MSRLGLVAALLFFSSASQSDASSVLAQMDGTWSGSSGDYLLVDAERSMANTEPDKPFNREPLQIKDISGSMVTFSVGGKIYIGLFRGGTVALTRLGRLGTLNLERLR